MAKEEERYVKKASKIAQEKNKEDVGFIGSFDGTCLIMVKLGEVDAREGQCKMGNEGKR